MTSAAVTPPFSVRIAYLLSRYPAVSHTFFLHEVRGLRERGFVVETASINLPDRAAEALPPQESEEAANTFYVKSHHGIGGLLAVLRACIVSPAAVMRAVHAAVRLGPASVAQRLYSLFYVAEALLLSAWIKRRGIAHLHIHFGGPVATVGMLAAAAAGIPYSLTIHGPDEFFDESRFYLRQKLQRAAFVICISDYCRSQLMRITSPPVWDRFDVVRLGVDPAVLPPRALRPAPIPVHVVSVGRLVSTKGPLLLLRALHAARQQGADVILTMVGEGPERPALQRYIDEHALQNVVTLAGALNHQQTLERVAGADLFVLASFAEGLPVALMEAMALGVPCISTYIAGIPELIQHEQNGLLVPAGSVAELTMAILRMARQPDLRQQFAEAGRLHVMQAYHLPTNLDLLAQTIQQRLASLSQHG